jgi:NADP-dependent 3-hydroxy acid dehydrogenase YdfG
LKDCAGHRRIAEIEPSVSRPLAASGTDVIISFRNKGPRAEEVADLVRAAGRRAILAEADIADETEVKNMMQVAGEVGRIDLLILNASGESKKDKPGRIVFVTSHLAHFYG